MVPTAPLLYLFSIFPYHTYLDPFGPCSPRTLSVLYPSLSYLLRPLWPLQHPKPICSLSFPIIPTQTPLAPTAPELYLFFIFPYHTYLDPFGPYSTRTLSVLYLSLSYLLRPLWPLQHPNSICSLFFPIIPSQTLLDSTAPLLYLFSIFPYHTYLDPFGPYSTRTLFVLYLSLSYLLRPLWSLQQQNSICPLSFPIIHTQTYLSLYTLWPLQHPYSICSLSFPIIPTQTPLVPTAPELSLSSIFPYYTYLDPFGPYSTSTLFVLYLSLSYLLRPLWTLQHPNSICSLSFPIIPTQTPLDSTAPELYLFSIFPYHTYLDPLGLYSTRTLSVLYLSLSYLLRPLLPLQHPNSICSLFFPIIPTQTTLAPTAPELYLFSIFPYHTYLDPFGPYSTRTLLVLYLSLLYILRLFWPLHHQNSICSLSFPIIPTQTPLVPTAPELYLFSIFPYHTYLDPYGPYSTLTLSVLYLSLSYLLRPLWPLQHPNFICSLSFPIIPTQTPLVPTAPELYLFSILPYHTYLDPFGPYSTRTLSVLYLSLSYLLRPLWSLQHQNSICSLSFPIIPTQTPLAPTAPELYLFSIFPYHTYLDPFGPYSTLTLSVLYLSLSYLLRPVWPLQSQNSICSLSFPIIPTQTPLAPTAPELYLFFIFPYHTYLDPFGPYSSRTLSVLYLSLSYLLRPLWPLQHQNSICSLSFPIIPTQTPLVPTAPELYLFSIFPYHTYLDPFGPYSTRTLSVLYLSLSYLLRSLWPLQHPNSICSLSFPIIDPFGPYNTRTDPFGPYNTRTLSVLYFSLSYLVRPFWTLQHPYSICSLSFPIIPTQTPLVPTAPELYLSSIFPYLTYLDPFGPYSNRTLFVLYLSLLYILRPLWPLQHPYSICSLSFPIIPTQTPLDSTAPELYLFSIFPYHTYLDPFGHYSTRTLFVLYLSLSYLLRPLWTQQHPNCICSLFFPIIPTQTPLDSTAPELYLFSIFPYHTYLDPFVPYSTRTPFVLYLSLSYLLRPLWPLQHQNSICSLSFPIIPTQTPLAPTAAELYLFSIFPYHTYLDPFGPYSTLTLSVLYLSLSYLLRPLWPLQHPNSICSLSFPIIPTQTPLAPTAPELYLFSIFPYHTYLDTLWPQQHQNSICSLSFPIIPTQTPLAPTAPELYLFSIFPYHTYLDPFGPYSTRTLFVLYLSLSYLLRPLWPLQHPNSICSLSFPIIPTQTPLAPTAPELYLFSIFPYHTYLDPFGPYSTRTLFVLYLSLSYLLRPLWPLQHPNSICSLSFFIIPTQTPLAPTAPELYLFSIFLYPTYLDPFGPYSTLTLFVLYLSLSYLLRPLWPLQHPNSICSLSYPIIPTQTPLVPYSTRTLFVLYLSLSYLLRPLWSPTAPELYLFFIFPYHTYLDSFGPLQHQNSICSLSFLIIPTQTPLAPTAPELYLFSIFPYHTYLDPFGPNSTRTLSVLYFSLSYLLRFLWSPTAPELYLFPIFPYHTYLDPFGPYSTRTLFVLYLSLSYLLRPLWPQQHQNSICSLSFLIIPTQTPLAPRAPELYLFSIFPYHTYLDPFGPYSTRTLFVLYLSLSYLLRPLWSPTAPELYLFSIFPYHTYLDPFGPYSTRTLSVLYLSLSYLLRPLWPLQHQNSFCSLSFPIIPTQTHLAPTAPLLYLFSIFPYHTYLDPFGPYSTLTLFVLYLSLSYLLRPLWSLQHPNSICSLSFPIIPTQTPLVPTAPLLYLFSIFPYHTYLDPFGPNSTLTLFVLYLSLSYLLRPLLPVQHPYSICSLSFPIIPTQTPLVPTAPELYLFSIFPYHTYLDPFGPNSTLTLFVLYLSLSYLLRPLCSLQHQNSICSLSFLIIPSQIWQKIFLQLSKTVLNKGLKKVERL